MSGSCCSKQPAQQGCCPECGSSSRTVSTATMLHHLGSPWKLNLSTGDYFYCDNRNCNTVYFNLGGARYLLGDLRPETLHALKHNTLCFCFGISEGAAKDDTIRRFIIEQTRDKVCSCKSSNPSGRCCLGNVPG